MDPTLKEVIGYVLQIIVPGLIGMVGWYVRELNKKNESLRATLHRIREANQEWRSAADLELQRLRSGMRIIAERARIKHDDIEEICEDRSLPRISNKSDSTMMT